MICPSCLLCGDPNTELYHRDNTRSYWECSVCGLVFVPLHQHLTPEEERQRYELHENSPDDQAYQTFLNKLAKPLNKILPSHSKGLDFGCGPGPTLNLMLEKYGHKMQLYDPFFVADYSVFKQSYDFITATEVAEHLCRPRKELDQLWRCLKPDGYFGIMTGMIDNGVSFPNWHYIRDDTHVAFYSMSTFRWLTDRWEASFVYTKNNVVIIHKSS